MRAGSSQVTGRKRVKGFVIAAKGNPVVEIDTEATAAYVRFSRGKIAKTEPWGAPDSMVMVDYDRSGRILGIEVIGTQEFSISKLLRRTPVRVSQEVQQRTRYVAAGLVPA